ncbi:nucleoside-diphosphate-sugar epimerase [Paraburkholderia rhizosphaerae]|uniref:Nucleoside-diphosphate-sugar epimerase n=2 Tax=Paraburkholderia rhizosphaerae TaxID=480658 RepID=A0A4R8L6E0_9BURK|nr:nucleoside-diphosphate-sugar epimerase [Paraburkholderia rhizosphaerae]
MRIFLAGASGVIGRSLVPLLRNAGHQVTGTTRTNDGRARLETSGIDVAVVDIFDKDALEHAVSAAAPDVVIHQLTDLSAGLDPASQEETLKRNARIRREGTANLVHAARTARVKRMIAQSIAWAYASKEPPYVETDPLDVGATGTRAISISEGVVPLESAVLQQSDFEGIVLRYGRFYGPGTWSLEPDRAMPVHVDAAAHAAFLAIEHGRPGIYNIAEPQSTVSIDKAIDELGWRADFRREPYG